LGWQRKWRRVEGADPLIDHQSTYNLPKSLIKKQKGQQSMPKNHPTLDNNNNYNPSNPLTQNTLKKRVILCNFVNSKSPKTTQIKGYSDHKSYTSNCEKMYIFWKKCVIKQPKTDKTKAIQLACHRKTTAQKQSHPQELSKNYTLFCNKNPKHLKTQHP